MPRKYELRQRAATAAATREKILAATIALHAEQGIAATSYKDIAQRASVGLGTVYHHFPTLDELIMACGGRLMEITRPPDPTLFENMRSRRSRIVKMVSEVFAWYERYPAWRRGLCDEDKLDVLARGVARREGLLRRFVAAGLSPQTSPETVTLVRALIDFEVYRTLVKGGIDAQEAARRVAQTILQGVPDGPPSRPAQT